MTDIEKGELLKIGFLIVNIILIFLNIHLANQKGRSPGIWLFLTICFSFFATIILLLAKEENSLSDI